MIDSITIFSIIVAAKGQVSTDLGGEAVILGLESGTYFSLNDSGSIVWNMIQKPRPVAELRDAILDEYDVESDVCERDLLALLGQLSDEGLIIVDADARH